MSNTYLQWCKLCHAGICFINGLGNTFSFYLFIYFCVCVCFLIAFGLIWTKINTHTNLIRLSAPFFITHSKTKTVSNLLTSHHLFFSNKSFDSNATLTYRGPLHDGSIICSGENGAVVIDIRHLDNKVSRILYQLPVPIVHPGSQMVWALLLSV